MRHCYLLYGMGGKVTSYGMNVLADKLRALPATTTALFTYGNYKDVIWSISQSSHANKQIVIGFSLGANATTNICNETPHRIDLLVAIDPSVWGYLYPLTPNVEKAICFHNTQVLNLFGKAKLEPGPHFPAHRLETINVSEWHMSIDYDEAIHNRIIQAVSAL